jgi:hypothetical protein
VVLLIGGGVFTAVKVSQRHNPRATAPPSTAPPNTGPFTGTYTTDYGPQTGLDGEPREGATPATETWGIRSVCRTSGCVATASRRAGQTTKVSTLVFDDIGGSWLAVGIGSTTCVNASVEAWEVYTLQPHPDGTLSGEYSTTSRNACEEKRAVTFTRTGDVDVNSLPDPASQPPRAVSAAEALHGRYRETSTWSNGEIQEYDEAVRTDCLRSGDRCMSYFHTGSVRLFPLVFGGGKWVVDSEFDDLCKAGGTLHGKMNVDYPLPQPPQNPITLLTGHGHQVSTGSVCAGTGYLDDKFVRTGD